MYVLYICISLLKCDCKCVCETEIEKERNLEDGQSTLISKRL